MVLNDETRALFQEEVLENLAELDGALLELEKAPTDLDLVNRIFRAVHTLKGACDMFGLSPVVGLAHDIESLFDHVRGGWRRVSKELLDASFAAKDRFAAMLAEGADPAAEDDPALRARLKELLRTPDMPVADEAAPAAGAEPEACAGPEPDDGPDRATPRSWRVCVAPSDHGHLAKADPLAVLDELRAMGNTQVRCDLGQVPDLAGLAPEDCLLRFEVVLTAEAGAVPDANALRDVFFFLENQADLEITPCDEALAEPLPAASLAAAPAGAVADWPDLSAVPAATPAAAVAAAARPAPAASRPASGTTPATASGPGPVAGHKPGEAAPDPAKKPQAAARKEAMQSLRVDAAKLDDLVNLVGELVIAQARLTQLATGFGHPALTSVAEEIERLSNELRDNTLGIRMLPIGTTFSRFRRLVRDLSSEMQKSIELVTEGGETELDKTVIEQLGDPLVHLLRNSIDHGIEPPGERLAAGKPETGTIVLSAEHAGGEVVLSITDDGRGMDPDRIRAKAEEKGLIPPDARLTESEIFNLVFLPGFSTAEKVTNVSGRGVGMDVVKRSMDSLRGKIDIQSTLGKGSRITIKLPLTLAIIDGLQIKAGDDQYIIPLSLVEECVELPRERTEASGRGRTIHLRGEIVPYIRLREAFELRGEAPAIEQVVVTRFEGERTGIAVDQVMGQQQTVIKSLGNYIGSVSGISGATINGDGTMSLILDVPTLVASVKRAAA
ncbi:CheA signal transduction histidine kinase [Solidesulfovibrio carbinoliphilus subsp. oakridgensis]|uniref:Chemotaxis protein CheA n=1 Tax=Solidesulfovibrio carbinoliphilus subsp. oakridgensis TaxID=694327 RepID=G7Q728_9BACT|nr:chemotaxis protein CheA [Solidesulfovibrio carbinoliphilus]EHJ48511.1 CheA signal transduction histidine kinase [Solidesulfovibrio carbinoliphilus subsp. oakridgensis]